MYVIELVRVNHKNINIIYTLAGEYASPVYSRPEGAVPCHWIYLIIIIWIYLLAFLVLRPHNSNHALRPWSTTSQYHKHSAYQFDQNEQNVLCRKHFWSSWVELSPEMTTCILSLSKVAQTKMGSKNSLGHSRKKEDLTFSCTYRRRHSR